MCQGTSRNIILALPFVLSIAVSQEKLNKHEFYVCRWQNNESDYTGLGMCREQLGCRDISEVCFCTKCKKKKENVTADMHVVKPVEDNKRQNFGRVEA